MVNSKKAAVFILLGQSNAVGHGLPMVDSDRITVPLRNIFGLHRRDNQSFDISRLQWSGYTSDGMNLAEEQDHTYSVVNCLAKQWQEHIDQGNAWGLPDLYIIQIAIGAQGVTKRYLWHPSTEQRLTPGVLGVCCISLFSFANHIFSLLDKSFCEIGKEYEIIGLHWRGGENDMCEDSSMLNAELLPIYRVLLDNFNSHLHSPPVYLHRLLCRDRANDCDPTGVMLKNMEYINDTFEVLVDEYENVFMFDPAESPRYVPDIRGSGIFMEDGVHFARVENEWVARWVIDKYLEGR